MNKTCETCKFWNPDWEKSPSGDCRKNTPVIRDSGNGRGVWPTTEKQDWCGEYKPAQEAKK